MKKYKVQFRTDVWINVEVEAEDENDAIDKAWQEQPCLIGYAGNGGSDKLCGVSGSNLSIEISDMVDEPKKGHVFEIE
jgi:hypothetical protein